MHVRLQAGVRRNHVRGTYEASRIVGGIRASNIDPRGQPEWVETESTCPAPWW